MTCITKAQECEYAGSSGQSRQEAMKSRLHSLEELVKSLREEPPENSNSLLQRIQSSEDSTTPADERRGQRVRTEERNMSHPQFEQHLRESLLGAQGI